MKGHQLPGHVLMASHWSSKTSKVHKHMYILCIVSALVPLAKTSHLAEAESVGKEEGKKKLLSNC